MDITSKIKDAIKSNQDGRLSHLISAVYTLIGGNRRKIMGGGNVIRLNNNYLRCCSIYIKGSNNIIDFSEGCNVLTNCKITIQGDNNRVVLGKRNNFINADLWIEDTGGEIIFGDRSQIHGYTHVAVIEGQSIKFGNECLLSTNVIFRVGDSHSILAAENEKRINPSKPIKIGNHVWFGHNTTILKGVEIQDNSIIGTGAVVTKPVPQSNVILVGNPAKIIKENINWNIIRFPIIENK